MNPFEKRKLKMIQKIGLIVVLAVQSIAMANTFDATEPAVCQGECTAGEFALDSEKKWYCMAKDSCGKTYIPECGNTCFSHAVSDAERLCAESSDDSDTCEVISPKNGSCSTNREELVRKSK
jgi:hypothetical protein